jgi:transposase-like protein
MARQATGQLDAATAAQDLERFACPNADCALFNRFAAGNLRLAQALGTPPAVRRLYCTHCGQRFSEHHGTLLRHSKLTFDTVVRLLKCLMHGCSIEAAADICAVQPHTVERLLQAAGQRAEDFHRLHLDQLTQPPQAVEMDELHARVAHGAGKKRRIGQPRSRQRLDGIAAQDAVGCMRRWP